MQVGSLHQEDLLEEGMATHSNILAWEIPWREEPSRVHGVKEIRHNLATKRQLYVITVFISEV